MGLFESFRRREHREAAPPTVPAGTRVYAIGDIHGRADLVGMLHDKIADHARYGKAERNCIIYLGDYIDRGLQSKEVIDLMLAGPPAGFEAIYLKGNHEDFLLQFLDDVRIGPGWVSNGGGATLYSYGARSLDRGNELERLTHLQTQMRELLPPSHLEFLRSLQLSHVEGDYYFVHAGVRPGVALDRQNPEDQMWIRDLFLHDDRDYGKIIVHGHTITDAPDIHANRIGVDTGAYASGVLTCLVLEGAERGFVQTSG